MNRMFAECWAKNVSLSGFLRSYSSLHVFSCSKLFFQKDKMAWSEAQKYAQACNQYNSIGPNVRHNKTRQDERRDKTKTSSKRERDNKSYKILNIQSLALALALTCIRTSEIKLKLLVGISMCCCGKRIQNGIPRTSKQPFDIKRNF